MKMTTLIYVTVDARRTDELDKIIDEFCDDLDSLGVQNNVDDWEALGGDDDDEK